MKTQLQIEFRIAVIESHINEILEMDRKDWNDFWAGRIENYLMGRTALQWVLSPDDLVIPDEYEKKVKYELLCHESSSIL